MSEAATEAADATDDDLKHADAPMVGKLAAAVSAASGLFVALCGLQIVGVRFRAAWIEWIPYLQIALGVTQIGVGAMIFRAREWAVLAGAGLNAVVALAMIGWFLFFVFGVGLSCMVLVTPPISVLAAVLSAVAIPAVRRTGAARRRLAERGLDLGL